MRVRWSPPRAAAAALLLAVTSLLWQLAAPEHAGLGVGLSVPAGAQTHAEALATASALGEAFSSVADEALPSVVTITSERVVAVRSPFGGKPFDDLFGFFGPRRRDEQPREFRQRGLGSGFIVSPDGVILTCSHVVREAENIRVLLWDDREFDAEIVGTDPDTDVAVLRIQADEPLPAMRLGDSDALRVGEWVLALGNPFGIPLQGTVTAGIVSAKGRSRVGLASYEDFIQTDAAINPGNSGGPLVNLRGQVIGINSAIASRTGGYQGVGFAIPIALSQHVMSSILREGRVVRGWLGVYIQDLTEELRGALGSDVRNGAVVSEVMEDGPAERAGIRAGDLIYEIDGRPLGSVNDLMLRVAEVAPGTRVTLAVLRDSQRLRIDVEVGEREGDEELAAVGRSDSLDEVGFEAEDVDDEWRGELELDPDIEGVVVTDVAANSAAERAGLQPGQVIIEADRRPVVSRRDLLAIVAEIEPGHTLLLYVVTDSGRRFVAIAMPAE